VDYNLSIGRFFNPDFSIYLSANGNSTVDTGASRPRSAGETFFELTPGFRYHLGNKWFVLGGVEVPLTGPRTQGFAWSAVFQVVKAF
jgi:hypothetical protein